MLDMICLFCFRLHLFDLFWTAQRAVLKQCADVSFQFQFQLNGIQLTHRDQYNDKHHDDNDWCLWIVRWITRSPSLSHSLRPSPIQSFLLSLFPPSFHFLWCCNGAICSHTSVLPWSALWQSAQMQSKPSRCNMDPSPLNWSNVIRELWWPTICSPNVCSPSIVENRQGSSRKESLCVCHGVI